MEVPRDLLYVSALGVRTNEVISFALSACGEHEVVLVILDSLGPAMVGDMAAAKDVIEFHNHYIAPFRETGATPLLVDHQARQQGGEGYQSKGAFGSAYKEHLSRSLIQVERGDQDAEQGALNVRIRHKKANFGALCDPFDVALSFSEEKITASVRELTSSDRAQETTLNSKERVTAALEDGPAYPDDLVESTGLTRGTIKNAITALKRAGVVKKTGETRGQMEQVQLAALAALPIKGNAASAAHEVLSVASAVEALRNGNAPRKALENYHAGVQNFESVVRSVLHFCYKDTEHWKEAAPNVLAAVNLLDEEG
jgi:DNA-binding transcriptional ArsR family regulator